MPDLPHDARPVRLAAAQRIEHFIQLRIDQCATAGEIKSELVANFGAGILAAPPRKGFDLLAWWLPIGGIILGALAVALRRLALEPRARRPTTSRRSTPTTERQLDELLARLD